MQNSKPTVIFNFEELSAIHAKKKQKDPRGSQHQFDILGKVKDLKLDNLNDLEQFLVLLRKENIPIITIDTGNEITREAVLTQCRDKATNIGDLFTKIMRILGNDFGK